MRFQDAHVPQNAGERKRAERAQKKRAVDRHLLRRTGRTELFPFRCNPELIKRVKDAAKKERIAIAAWMEDAMEAKLASGEGSDA